MTVWAVVFQNFWTFNNQFYKASASLPRMLLPFTVYLPPWQSYKIIERLGTSSQTERPLHREMPKGHWMDLPKLWPKVTTRISYDSFLSLSINNNSNKALVICHFRPRDVIKFKSTSDDTGYRTRNASQDQLYQIHSALSCLSISWKHLLTNASPVNRAWDSECQVL